MKNEELQSNQELLSVENWTKPEINLLSVKDDTLGSGGGGPDFASEIS